MNKRNRAVDLQLKNAHVFLCVYFLMGEPRQSGTLEEQKATATRTADDGKKANFCSPRRDEWWRPLSSSIIGFTFRPGLESWSCIFIMKRSSSEKRKGHAGKKIRYDE